MTVTCLRYFQVPKVTQSDTGILPHDQNLWWQKPFILPAIDIRDGIVRQSSH
jgi:hypothetical protein